MRLVSFWFQKLDCSEEITKTWYTDLLLSFFSFLIQSNYNRQRYSVGRALS